MEYDLVGQAVLLTSWQKQSTERVILHSDRGSQYSGQEHLPFLATHDIVAACRVGSRMLQIKDFLGY